MHEMTQKYLGVPIEIQEWRHVCKAIMREYWDNDSTLDKMFNIP